LSTASRIGREGQALPTWRRGTETSWRSTGISASLLVEDRRSKPSQPNNFTVIKYIIRNNTVGEHGTTPREAQRQVSEPKSSKGTAHGSIEVIELRDIAHDVINSMLSGFPKGALPGVLEKVAGANGLIAVSPVFTTSYSGLFKSFMDVLGPDSLAGMPVLPGATGGTPRHSLALEYAMRPLFTYLRAEVVTASVFAATGDWVGEADTVTPLPKRIERAGREFATRILEAGTTLPRAARRPAGGVTRDLPRCPGGGAATDHLGA
jgi:LLM-partnered FMN reductase